MAPALTLRQQRDVLRAALKDLVDLATSDPTETMTEDEYCTREAELLDNALAALEETR